MGSDFDAGMECECIHVMSSYFMLQVLGMARFPVGSRSNKRAVMQDAKIISQPPFVLCLE